MIIKFPDLDALRAALGTLGHVGGRVAYDGDAIIIDTPSRLRSKAIDAETLKRYNGTFTEEVVSCAQLLPLERTSMELAANTPVYFLIPEADMVRFVSEVLRQDNDRISYRCVEGEMIVRVVGPSHYTLSGDYPGYVEQSPKLWVRHGYRHPHAQYLKVQGGITLVDAPRSYRYLPEGPFEDVYNLITFTVPAPTVLERSEAQRFTIPLRLVPTSTPMATELWVTTIPQIQALVHHGSESLLKQVSFAVCDDVVVLRARHILPIDGEEYTSYLKIPNLFVPKGMRLFPNVRRETVVATLANDEDTLTYITREGQPRRLNDRGFHMLSEWVDYVLETQEVFMNTWIKASKFNLPIPKAYGGAVAPPPVAPTTTTVSSAPKGAAQVVTKALETVHLKPIVRNVSLKVLQDQFLALTSPLNDPERTSLWKQMSHVAQGDDAVLAWLHGSWYEERLGPCPIQPSKAVATALATSKSQELERVERDLPIRLAWFSWLRVAKGDVLMLARARDRLLERLYTKGLINSLDIPLFLRRASDGVSSETLLHFRDLALRWVDANPVGTKYIVQAMFDHALGNRHAPEKLPNNVIATLVSAYHDPQTNFVMGNATDQYMVDRWRATSRIISGGVILDAFRNFRKYSDAQHAELAKLYDAEDRDAIIAVLKKATMSDVVIEISLDLAPRLGEAYTLGILKQLPEKPEILAKGLIMASHYGLSDQVRAIVGRLKEAPPLRGLKRMGMTEEISKLLETGDIESRLHAAQAWDREWDRERAQGVIREGREKLFKGDLKHPHQTRLACAYAQVVDIEGLEEMFKELKGVSDSSMTNKFYSLSQLTVVEAVVQALTEGANENRRWADADEFEVRQRIHTDMRRMTNR